MEKQIKLLSVKALQKRLITQRVKHAKHQHDKEILAGYGRSKSQSSKQETCSSDGTRFSEDSCIFSRIMPPRRTWVHLREEHRYSKDKQYRLTSVDQNRKALEITLKRDMNNKEPYILLQLQVLKSLRKRIFNYKYEFSRPRVNKEFKNEKELRPVSSFPIFDNIILQECSKVLSTWFDPLFCDCSFAFRVKGNGKKAPTHHDTITKILSYIHSHDGQQIFVAECDLRKFYDTINHDEIKNSFNLFMEKVDNSYREKKILEHLFFSYLNCYDYQESVLKLNDDAAYLEGANGREFIWVDPCELNKVYGDYTNYRIGVPQGGALSGLIANIVLHDVDKKLEELKDPDLLYMRFCDDMIMLHIEKERLGKAFSVYQDELKKKKLFIHKPVNLERYSYEYYDTKSKTPFAFGPKEKQMIPWITFVGYDINHMGEVRVRKKTIEKQMKKQNDLVTKAIKFVKRSEVPVKRRKVIESVRSRLIGMSIGRITLYGKNDKKVMCWAKGFPCLTTNPYSIRQMKRLDRSRRNQIHRLYTSLPADMGQQVGGEPMSQCNVKKKASQIIYNGNPFSYHHWLINKEI